jgi:arylformamidase
MPEGCTSFTASLPHAVDGILPAALLIEILRMAVAHERAVPVPKMCEGPSMSTWTAMTQTERDAAYNNGTAVAGSAQIVEGWIAASDAFRARRPGHVDLPYGPGERNKWDLFPSQDPEAPCLVWIHGGYWQARSRENFSCFAEGILKCGWSAAFPGYTLAPAASLTGIVREMHSAFDWLAAHGGAHGIVGPFLVAGWSAGGHLATMMLDHPRVRAGLAVSGLYELGPLRDTYINERLRLTGEEVATLSPLRRPSVNKPLAIAYGTDELEALIHNSRDFHAHRAQSHCAGALIPIPNANHYTVLEEFRSPDGILTCAALRLMQDVR